MTKTTNLTSQELLARLSQDPEFLANEERRAKERVLREAQHREIEKPVLQNLESLGLKVSSIADLVRDYAPLGPEVTGPLLSWIPRIENESVNEGLVRALAAAAEPFDGHALIEAFEKTQSEEFRWAIANTMAEGRPYGVADWLMEVVPDPSYGKAREMLVLALARLVVSRRANDVLLAVFDQLPGHAAAGLAEAGGLRELKVLRDMREKYKGWVKKEIDRAIRSITKRLNSVSHASDLIS